jgi:hypothetical protein
VIAIEVSTMSPVFFPTGGEHLGLAARKVEGLELMAEADTVALQAIVADSIAFYLQVPGEGMVAAERAFDDKATDFGAHRSGQRRDF